jgi:hypothetical protein
LKSSARRHAHPCAACGARWAPVDVSGVVDGDDREGGGDAALCPRCGKDRLLHVPLLLELAAGGDPRGFRAEAWRRWANDVRREYRLRLLAAVVYAAVAAFAVGMFFEQWWPAR